MTISIQISASQVRTWGLRWGRSVQVPGPFSFPTQPRAHLQSHQRCPSSSQQPRAKLSWHEIPTESYFTTTELKSKELKSHARTPLKSSSVTSEQRGSCTSALPWLWQSCQMPSRRSRCHETFHHLDRCHFGSTSERDSSTEWNKLSSHKLSLRSNKQGLGAQLRIIHAAFC